LNNYFNVTILETRQVPYAVFELGYQEVNGLNSPVNLPASSKLLSRVIEGHISYPHLLICRCFIIFPRALSLSYI